jgi:hypothetical protein
MKEDINRRIKSSLAKNNACYVLITCNDSVETGSLEVEMSYKGDAPLTSYLLEEALLTIDKQFEESEDLSKKSKIVPIS